MISRSIVVASSRSNQSVVAKGTKGRLRFPTDACPFLLRTVKHVPAFLFLDLPLFMENGPYESVLHRRNWKLPERRKRSLKSLSHIYHQVATGTHSAVVDHYR